MKTVILSKSCSRCGGSTIFKGQTLQKSVPRPTPNDNGARKRKKSVPAPSPDPLFRPQNRFWWTFRLLPGPGNHQKLQCSCLRLAPGAQLFAGLVKIKHKLRAETLGKLFAGLAISGCGGLALAFSNDTRAWTPKLESIKKIYKKTPAAG